MLIQIAYCRNIFTVDNKLVDVFQRAVLLFPRPVPRLFFTTVTTPLKHYIVSMLERYSALHNTFDESSEHTFLFCTFFSGPTNQNNLLCVRSKISCSLSFFPKSPSNYFSIYRRQKQIQWPQLARFLRCRRLKRIWLKKFGRCYRIRPNLAPSIYSFQLSSSINSLFVLRQNTNAILSKLNARILIYDAFCKPNNSSNYRIKIGLSEQLQVLRNILSALELEKGICVS